jgi:hypothetical protein
MPSAFFLKRSLNTDEVIDQQRHVAPALAQRRQVERARR